MKTWYTKTSSSNGKYLHLKTKESITIEEIKEIIPIGYHIDKIEIDEASWYIHIIFIHIDWINDKEDETETF